MSTHVLLKELRKSERSGSVGKALGWGLKGC